MSLIKRPKWEVPNVRSMLNEFWDKDDFFGSNFFKQEVPAVNVKETKDHFMLEFAAPGMVKKDFNISIENGCLTVSAKKEEKKEEKDEDYTRQEFSYRAFERSFTLPESVDKDAVSAKYQDGILKINLEKTPVAKKEKAKAIQIS